MLVAIIVSSGSVRAPLRSQARAAAKAREPNVLEEYRHCQFNVVSPCSPFGYRNVKDLLVDMFRARSNAEGKE
jgi:hypothetical protein